MNEGRRPRSSRTARNKRARLSDLDARTRRIVAIGQSDPKSFIAHVRHRDLQRVGLWGTYDYNWPSQLIIIVNHGTLNHLETVPGSHRRTVPDAYITPPAHGASEPFWAVFYYEPRSQRLAEFHAADTGCMHR